MTKGALQSKQEKAESLRQKIREERAKRERIALDAEIAQRSATLDLEIERLQAELEAEVAQTKAQAAAAKSVVTNPEVDAAKAAAQTAKVVAQQTAEGTQQNKEN